MRNVLFVLLINFLLSYSVLANEFWQEQLPHDLTKLNVKKVGSAKFSVLFWDIYTSTLFTTSGKYAPENPNDTLIFEINYLRDISSEDLIKRTKEQWQHLGFKQPQYNAFIPQLSRIWPNISAGDTLALIVKNEQSQFYFNNEKIGGVEQKSFAKLFLAIWLSPKTSQPSLRQSLLGKNDVRSD